MALGFQCWDHRCSGPGTVALNSLVHCGISSLPHMRKQGYIMQVNMVYATARGLTLGLASTFAFEFGLGFNVRVRLLG